MAKALRETQLQMPLRFDGATYDAARDCARLSGLLARVLDYVKDGEWRTLDAIAAHCGGSEASVSARLRDLRKARFGSFNVERRYVANGLYEYRLAPRAP